jgi:hypothetical protein
LILLQFHLAFGILIVLHFRLWNCLEFLICRARHRVKFLVLRGIGLDKPLPQQVSSGFPRRRHGHALGKVVLSILFHMAPKYTLKGRKRKALSDKRLDRLTVPLANSFTYKIGGRGTSHQGCQSDGRHKEMLHANHR